MADSWKTEAGARAYAIEYGFGDVSVYYCDDCEGWTFDVTW
jgi:hypothetical protein